MTVATGERQQLRDVDDARLDLALCESGFLSGSDKLCVVDRAYMILTRQNGVLRVLLLIISMLLAREWEPANPLENPRLPEEPRRSELL
ncbi:MAG: hypothetical protein O2964_19965 [Verrucomicrobia bacterium]|nr:hypothetical protein [Verrucomicrobiota bacterium]